MAIARVWRGVTRAARADEYLDYLNETGVAACRATEGNLGVRIMRRVDDGHAEFVFVSLWESFDAIRRFAGDDYERAVYYPEDEGFLLELEPNVAHYEVAVDV
jgi:heme-degrading monooxygenase HmoA